MKKLLTFLLILLFSLRAFSAVDTVRMYNYYFEPESLTIESGDTIVWVNETQVAHTATSEDQLFDEDVEGGGSFSFTFDSEGTFNYTCTIHADMDGTIIVE